MNCDETFLKKSYSFFSNVAYPRGLSGRFDSCLINNMAIIPLKSVSRKASVGGLSVFVPGSTKLVEPAIQITSSTILTSKSKQFY